MSIKKHVERIQPLRRPSGSSSFSAGSLYNYLRGCVTSVIIIMAVWLMALTAHAQEPPVEESSEEAEIAPEVSQQVDVEPVAQDDQIEERLISIMEATEWFIAPKVEVQDGVVFLDGQAHKEAYQEWAGNLARNTQDVVAVVNRIKILPQPIWNFSPAIAEIQALWRDTIQAIPLILFGTVVLLLSWWLSKWVRQLAHYLFSDKIGSPLLTQIATRAIAIPVFLLGVYLVLQVAGLTRLALTLLGGTGIVGIVIGFAFRDIAENFLASVLLSIRSPYRNQDVINVAGYTGVVQQLNTRSTLLMTFDGNHVQIPNAVIFKSTITNYTINPNQRADFVIGIGYDASILQAQELVSEVLDSHPAVLETPEPLVLVEELGPSTVNLRVYFWCNSRQYSYTKIRSSLIRLTKHAFVDAGISMPDAAREIIFPQGVPVIPVTPTTLDAIATDAEIPQPAPIPASKPMVEVEPITSASEGDLHSDEEELRDQAEQSRPSDDGEDLLGSKDA